MDNAPEVPSRPEHIPPLETVSSAYKDILDHNKKNTGVGTAIAGMMQGLIKEEKDNTPLGDTLDKKRVEGEMNAELQELFHSDTFTRIGLKVAPFGSQVAEWSGKSVTSAELVPMVDNTSLYKEFLSTMTPQDAALEANGVLLRDVVNNLSRTITVCYQPPKDITLTTEERQVLRQYGEDTLRKFTEIDPQYKRLDLGNEESYDDVLAVETPQDLGDEYSRYVGIERFKKNYRGLEKAVEYWGKNVLPEYIEGSWYLTPPDEKAFGPADWHKDGGQRHWREAFDFLRRMDGDERTKAFGGEVKQALTTSVTAAIEEIDLSEEKPYYAGQRGDLVNIRNYLSGEQHDQAKLDEYTKPPDYSK